MAEGSADLIEIVTTVAGVAAFAGRTVFVDGATVLAAERMVVVAVVVVVAGSTGYARSESSSVGGGRSGKRPQTCNFRPWQNSCKPLVLVLFADSCQIVDVARLAAGDGSDMMTRTCNSHPW